MCIFLSIIDTIVCVCFCVSDSVCVDDTLWLCDLLFQWIPVPGMHIFGMFSRADVPKACWNSCHLVCRSIWIYISQLNYCWYLDALIPSPCRCHSKRTWGKSTSGKPKEQLQAFLTCPFAHLWHVFQGRVECRLTVLPVFFTFGYCTEGCWMAATLKQRSTYICEIIQ